MLALKLLEKRGIRPRGVIHVGANIGQEFEAYRHAAVEPVVYVEPIPEMLAALRKTVGDTPGHLVVDAVCAEADGLEVTFNVASNAGGSSSLLQLGRHAELYPNIRYVRTLRLTTVTLDSLLARHAPGQSFGLLVADVQGAELRVLKGASGVLGQVGAVFLEVSKLPFYEGGCTYDELVAFLGGYGFKPYHSRFNDRDWGNALFLHPRAEGRGGA